VRRKATNVTQQEMLMLFARTIHTIAWTALAIGLAISPAQGGTMWFSTESDCDFSHLYSVDTDTSVVTDRGSIRGLNYLTDIAVTDTGTLYGVGWNNGKASGNSSLYVITPGSASTAGSYSELDIKSNKLQNSVNGLAWRDGQLYACSDNGKFQVMEYKDDRWEVTNDGSMHADGGGDLAFASDGTLYVALQNGYLGTIGLDGPPGQVGRATVIGQSGYQNLFGLASIDGTLFGTTVQGYCNESQLVRLDTVTGRGYDAVSLPNNVWGATGYTAVPEPATICLIGVGGSLLVLRRIRNLRRRAA
jgi:hypothetical protein